MMVESNSRWYELIPDNIYSNEHPWGKLDIYLPKNIGKHPLPCVILIHGGGWAIGDKADKRERSMAECLVRNGYAAVSINYTLSEYQAEIFHSPLLKPGWPHNLMDCKAALHFIQKNASAFHIDPDRIGLIGSSAGGHLALLTALTAVTPADVKCVIDMYGIPDVRLWGGASLIGGTYEEAPEQWNLASPVYHLTKQMPPLLIIHGSRDEVVDISQSLRLVHMLQQLGVEHTFIQVDGGVHSFDFHPPQVDLEPAIFSFLCRHLT